MPSPLEQTRSRRRSSAARRVTEAAVIAVAFSAVSVPSVWTAAQASPAEHVVICHATGSKSHPYVQIAPSKEGVLDGHSKEIHQYVEDIIPPFDGFPGQNWNSDGMAIYASGCGSLGADPLPGMGAYGAVGMTALLGVAFGVALVRRRRTARSAA
jgi:hypothetical protein